MLHGRAVSDNNLYRSEMGALEEKLAVEIEKVQGWKDEFEEISGQHNYYNATSYT